MADFSPAQPRRLLHPPALSLLRQPLAQGRACSASFVLGSTKSSTYPLGNRAVQTARGWAGGNVTPPVFVSPAALLDGAPPLATILSILHAVYEL